MASDLQLVSHVCEQMSDLSPVTYRKMFGEYALYAYGKCFGLVCDNSVYITSTKVGDEMLCEAPRGTPYPGSKERIILQELEDREFLSNLILKICEELPPPKPKRKKTVQF